MNTKLLLPVYDDTLLLDALAASHRIGPRLLAILNPNSGSNLTKSQVKPYQRAIKSLSSNRSSILGYIDLHQGDGFTGPGPRKIRKTADILIEIARWNDLGVTSFFFDDAVDWQGTKIKPLLEDIRAFLIHLDTSWLNPGAPAPGLASLGANLITLEDTTSKNAPAGPSCGWIMLGRKTLPPIPAGLGAYFATDRAPSSAFQALPTYWNQLLNKFPA